VKLHKMEADMLLKRFAGHVFGCLLMTAGAGHAQTNYGPGVTDTEIVIGQTNPYSGPLSSYSTQGRVQAAYYRMINEQGGVNGRKLKFISLDDGYSPPKTVEQTRPPRRPSAKPTTSTGVRRGFSSTTPHRSRRC
jgi:ABC-type branched-subunit amino acid transport system substrate-binding protein